MHPRRGVGKQRRAQIIEAATTVFAQKGFERATMEDIADAVGINKATIYLYIDSKDALVRAIAEHLFTQEVSDLEEIADSAGSAAEKITAYYETLIAGEADVMPMMPIIYEFYALGLRRDDVRRVLADFIGRSVSLLERIIQEGIDKGEFASVDARHAARVLIALLDGIVLQSIYASNDLDVDAQLRAALQLLYGGLL